MSYKTEMLVLNELKDILVSGDIIMPYIEENDKTPVWDGNLFIYNNPSVGNYDHKKEDLNSKIPVQVKGKTVEKVHQETASYYFSITDLKAYYTDGGVILFLGEVDSKDNSKKGIFYKLLLPYDIKQITKNFSSDLQNNVKISLKRLRKKDIKRFEEECENFIINKELQFSTKGLSLPLEEAKQLIIKGKNRNSSLYDYLLNNKVYVYGKKHEEDVIPLVVDKFDFLSIEQKVKREISIKDKVYFKDYQIKKTKNENKIILNKNLEFVFKDNSCKFNYKFHDNFKKRLKCVEFIKEIIENNGFNISDQFVSLQQPNTSEYQEIKNNYKHLKRIGALLDFFNVQYSKLDMGEIDSEDAINLETLIDSIILGNEVSNINNLPGILKVEIGNINLLTFIYKYNDKTIIKDFSELQFHQNIKLKTDDRELKNISPFIMLKSNDILEADNITPKVISKSVMESTYNKINRDYIVVLLLEIIKTFDGSKDTKYLDAGLEICKWLKNHDESNPVHTINELQIYARKRFLRKEEKNELKQIVKASKNHENSNMLSSCAYVLLNEISKFNKEFNKLSIEEKKQFKNYPIYQLYKNRE